MPFEKVEQLPDFPALEGQILQLWKDRDVFHRSLEDADSRPGFVFYEGPPTANGLPHNGHVLTRVMKDLFPRYRTMRGYHVERWAGWDTHGLPVEVEVEKELRIRGKQAIMEYGVEAFSKRCLQSVFRYTSQWEHLTERIGFWVDLDKAYVTYHKSYVESVWWALAKLFDEGLLYKGHKVVWWWAQGGTALSAGETGDSYKTVDDPSVYVRFPLKDEHASLVVWTTTPWTLPSNMFAAVHGELPYVYAKDPKNGEVLILAQALKATLEEKLGRELKVKKTVKGETLFGKRYKPPFDTHAKGLPDNHAHYFRIVPGDTATGGPPQWFVTTKAGTGVVHVAPAFGEDDWKVWRNMQTRHGEIPLLCAVRPDGKFDATMGALEDVWVKDADKHLIKQLEAAGLLLHSETYRHDYPFCWRSDNDPLIQYAREAWFIKTTKHIDQVIENNEKVHWLPEHIRDGRFGDFLAGNVDWALSRERFWGTPLNIWECEGCGAAVAPRSCADIVAKDPEAFSAFAAAKAQDPTLSDDLIVHKPWIDQVTLRCEKCQGTMRRVPEVIDCWFDSGCMPFAQFGYPHLPSSKEAFERAFPADFISEAIDQTRGWFYSLMMISNLLFPEREAPHPYKRCIVLGHVSDKSGKKESKSIGNYTPPEVILDRVRMAFAPVQMPGITAKPGEVLIAREDLDGLDLNDAADVLVYRESAEAPVTMTLHAHKKLPRRVVVMNPGDRERLGLRLAQAHTRPAEVPSLPAEQQVIIEAKGIPAPGADAFRWFFYASNPPWNNTRHSLGNVRSLQKELPLKLRSVYAFFVTYANIDGFDPAKDRASRLPVGERALLDRWIMSELEGTKRKVVEAMDAFLSYDAAQALSAFVEGLSNWYVRRSRARFWAEGRGQDKLDAYWTLFTVLKDLAKYLAPFVPFLAEDMYQNLVVNPYGDAPPDSVHLCLLPNADGSLIDEPLSATMAQLRELVSLGLKVRTDNKLRVRQPLASAQIIMADSRQRAGLESHMEMMAQELNVKAIHFVDDAADYVDYRVKPNFQRLGKRLGKKMKATAAAIRAADANQLKLALDTDGAVTVDVDGDAVRLTDEEVIVEVAAKEGFAAAGGAVGVVVLNTQLSPVLVAEGLYREVLSKVQSTRKELQLEYASRIKLAIDGDAEVLAACEARRDGLASEVLANEIVIGGTIDAERREVKVDGRVLFIEIEDLGVPSSGPHRG